LALLPKVVLKKKKTMFESDRRSIFCIIILLAFVSAGIALLMRYFIRSENSLVNSSAKIEQARSSRQTPLLNVAPAQLPMELPLVGKNGEDEYGYPLQYIDKPAILSLLWHKKYKELTAIFETLQKNFETDYHKEYWVYDAADAFDSPDPGLLDSLNEWISATPDSFAPYLARCTYQVAVASAQRGSNWAKDTPTQDFQAMEKTLVAMLPDISKAIELSPLCVAAYRVKLKYLMLVNDKEGKDWAIRDAIKICPSCFQVRVTYLYSITPRWGGSYEEMESFIEDTPVSLNAKFKLLKGYIYLDKATLLYSSKNFSEALNTIEKACSLGDHWEFLYHRAQCKRALKDYDGALADLNKALELRPNSIDVLAERMRVLLLQRQWLPAGNDMLSILRVTPANPDAKALYDTVVKGLIYEGWEKHKSGDDESALKILNIAAEIAPENKDLANRRAWIIANRKDKAPDIGENNILEPPDDFQEMQTLDYNLARKGQYSLIVNLWSKFIEKHPNEGRAYLERGGAYYHLGRIKEALNDAQKACEMGITEGCVHAKQLAKRLEHN